MFVSGAVLRSICLAVPCVIGAVVLPFIKTSLSHSGEVSSSQKSDPIGASILRSARSSSGDLELGGELAGLPAGSIRYARYEDLLSLPQESYSVTDDSNFHGKTQISGVPLTALAKLFGQDAHSDLIVAICYDKYRSNYPSDYLAAHHPILVLKINGKLRARWPISEYGGPMGPYLISHPTFTPSFKVLSHADEAQVPFGVTRLDFRSESVVLGTIKPAGNWAVDSPVWQGYRIASQDCFRCHGLYGEGGERASRSWLVLAAWAATDSGRFQQYIRKPTSIQACARMPAHSDYDDATLAALTEYFKTFVPARKTQ
jgi:mono/diheme cytochrome c family protein